MQRCGPLPWPARWVQPELGLGYPDLNPNLRHSWSPVPREVCDELTDLLELNCGPPSMFAGSYDAEAAAAAGEGLAPDPSGWHSAEEGTAAANRHVASNHLAHDAEHGGLDFAFDGEPLEAGGAASYQDQPQYPGSESVRGDGRTQAEAGQQVEGDGPAGSVGAELDELDVPMVWLEPPAATGPAVEDEDYD